MEFHTAMTSQIESESQSHREQPCLLKDHNLHGNISKRKQKRHLNPTFFLKKKQILLNIEIRFMNMT